MTIPRYLYQCSQCNTLIYSYKRFNFFPCNDCITKHGFVFWMREVDPNSVLNAQSSNISNGAVNPMIYVHYEKFRIRYNQPVFRDFVKLNLSSSQTRSYISGNNSKSLKILVDLLKQIPPSERTYDPKTHIWIIPKDKFNTFLSMRGTLVRIIAGFIEHTDLEAWIHGREEKQDSKTIPRVEDFFYTYGQPAPTVPVSKESIALQLEKLFKLVEPDFIIISADKTELQKLYRRTALLLHPDRNSGDGSKMSELNYLWQTFNKI